MEFLASFFESKCRFRKDDSQNKLLIYPSIETSSEWISKVLSDSRFFVSNKKFDFNTIDQRPSLNIIGIEHNEFELTEELSNQGVADIFHPFQERQPSKIGFNFKTILQVVKCENTLKKACFST